VIGLLETLVSGIEAIGDYVLVAGIDLLNLFFEAIQAAVEAALLLLPTMPSPISGSEIDGLAWLNWFYPFGSVLSGFVGLLALYTTWLGLSWLLALVRAD
jgi:hypothetical protein